MIQRHCAEVMDRAVAEWKKFPERSVDTLIARYESSLSHSFLFADTLKPATDPNFISENTFAVTADDVEVKNVVNCTGGVLKNGELTVGFHILGFAKVDGGEDAVDDDSKRRVAQNMTDMVSLLEEPPTTVVLNASTLGRGISTLDQGHDYVEQQLRRALAERFPQAYPTQEDIPVQKVRSLDYGSKKE
jgi:hypothetical protein